MTDRVNRVMVTSSMNIRISIHIKLIKSAKMSIMPVVRSSPNESTSFVTFDMVLPDSVSVK